MAKNYLAQTSRSVLRLKSIDPRQHICCYKRKKEMLVTQSHLTLYDPWTGVCQAPLSMGFSRQEYWSGFPFPSPGDLPDPGMEPGSPAVQADSLPSEPLG